MGIQPGQWAVLLQHSRSLRKSEGIFTHENTNEPGDPLLDREIVCVAVEPGVIVPDVVPGGPEPKLVVGSP